MSYKKKHIKDWLKSHPLIDLRKLKTISGITFNSIDEVNENQLRKIEAVLFDYGYTEQEG